MVEPTPTILVCDCVTSALDTAYEQFSQGRLGVWDSVLALRQTQGRGQLRRFWDSPPGNIYAALRLPCRNPFTSSACALATATLLSRALADALGDACQFWLKWPNDLVVCRAGQPAKIAGILLEERNECLLAGIGVNLKARPIRMRSDAALPVCALEQVCPGFCWQPQPLWSALVKRMISFYDGGHFSSKWLDLANQRLLWRDSAVVLRDGAEKLEGILLGIGAEGCALLAHSGEVREIFSGSLAARVGNGHKDICGCSELS